MLWGLPVDVDVLQELSTAPGSTNTHKLKLGVE